MLCAGGVVCCDLCLTAAASRLEQIGNCRCLNKLTVWIDVFLKLGVLFLTARLFGHYVPHQVAVADRSVWTTLTIFNEGATMALVFVCAGSRRTYD